MESLGLGHYERMPANVVFRMSALVGGEDIVFGDVRLELANNGRRVTGEAVAYTATRVVYAVITEAQLDDEPPRGVSTVDCRARARRDLQTVGIAAPDSDHNEDYAWHNDWGSIIPAGSQLTLRYADKLVLRLPCKPTEGRAARLDAFLPALLADL